MEGIATARPRSNEADSAGVECMKGMVSSKSHRPLKIRTDANSNAVSAIRSCFFILFASFFHRNRAPFAPQRKGAVSYIHRRVPVLH